MKHMSYPGHWTRRLALGGLAAMALAGCQSGSGGAPALAEPAIPAPQPPARPNILFILIDDMGFGDLSLTGNRLVATPNIDALARDGLVMTQFYAGAPICSPSRAAFMTGRFPARDRFVTFIHDRKRNREFNQADCLDPALPNVAHTLRRAGYATGHFGKWHLGGGRDIGDAPAPTAYGFDESLTQFEGLGPRILPREPANNLAAQSAALGQGPVEWVSRATVSARFVDRTLDFVKRRKDRPWFAQLWLDDVHTPWIPDADQLAAVRGKGRNERETKFLAALVAMDAQIGRLVAGLRAAGELDDTLIILTSDNGPTVGPETPGSAGPYRGRKASLYEGGVRQPLILRWPGRIEPGRRDARSLVQAIDLLPTLANIAGAPRPAGIDGIDIGAAWRGTPITARPDLYSHVARPAGEAYGPLYSIRSGPWKLLSNIDGTGAELYNIDRDPRETRNRAKDFPAITKRLSGRMASWIATLPPPGAAVGR